METKDRILQGAEELFFKHGIKSITMNDIAKHLAISKKTIYQFYSDKNAVVETLMKVKLGEDRCQFEDIRKNSENVVVEVFEMMKSMTSIFSSVNPNLFYDMQKYHIKAWKLFKQFKEDCIEKMVAASIERGINEGLVRPDINPKILARLRMEEIEMSFNSEVFPPDKYKMVEVQVALMDHFLHGICTLKGHKLINKHKEIFEEE